MLARADAESLFLDNLQHIERTLRTLARRYGIDGDEADDFTSWAKARLIENDYAAIAKFRGESSVTTYLTVVLAMLGREYLVQQHGRWRPSAAARRAGPVATRLERLVYRDRLPFRQAVEQLRTAGETTLSDQELAALLTRLPRREAIRPANVGDSPLHAAQSTGRADDTVDAEGETLEWERAWTALARALGTLPEDERVLVRLRFWEELSIADIARALGVPQKPLYRRLERALTLLRHQLEAEGVSSEVARAVTTDHGGPGSVELASIYNEHDARSVR